MAPAIAKPTREVVMGKTKLTEEQRKIKRTAMFDQAMAYQLEHYGGEHGNDAIEEMTRIEINGSLAAGVDEALIYASIKTSRSMLTEEGFNLLSKEDQAEWIGAVNEYHKAMDDA
jgi:hypothetical protein